MNPTLEQLARYVAQELERGVPEAALYAAMRESGWTPEWVDAAVRVARQRAVPAASNPLNMPPVEQQPFADTSVPMQPVRRPAQRPVQPLVRPVPKKQPKAQTASWVPKALWVLTALLLVGAVGLGMYRYTDHIQKAAQQKVIRDAERREDLSIFLSDLSDYFVTNQSYPTRTQLNGATFLDENGFIKDSISDPSWKAKNEACTKDGKPVFAGDITPGCYAYEVTTGKNGICNNSTTACTKAKVSIWLEVDQKPYEVVFSKNTQTD